MFCLSRPPTKKIVIGGNDLFFVVVVVGRRSKHSEKRFGRRGKKTEGQRIHRPQGNDLRYIWLARELL